MKNAREALRTRLTEIADLEAAAALLQWDQATYMPRLGAAARGRTAATLQRLVHERWSDPALGDCIGQLEADATREPDSDEARCLAAARRDHDRATRIPPEFTETAHRHFAATYSAWVDARPRDDFASVAPFLETTLALSREYSSFFPDAEHVADPLIDDSDPGMRATTVRARFDELRAGLVPLVSRIAEATPVDTSCLHGTFAPDRQLAFGAEVIRRLGFDFDRGRQDLTPHPFMTKFSLSDVRITTRVKDDDLSEALFSTIHEAGHAMYEMGIDPSYEATPLAHGTSSGIHESQSRLWENLVARSRGFWRYWYPRLVETFPGALGNVAPDAFYRAIHHVAPSPIRTDADEVTYNLHVMIRFDLEIELLEGNLAISDLAQAWRDRYRSDLGIEIDGDRDGVLQDVHWFAGFIGGAFQGYTLGNLMAAQFYAAAVTAHPEIPSEIEQGRFETLRGWLTREIYRHGRKYRAEELIERATGRPLEVEPLLTYLRETYEPVYGLR